MKSGIYSGTQFSLVLIAIYMNLFNQLVIVICDTDLKRLNFF